MGVMFVFCILPKQSFGSMQNTELVIQNWLNK